MRISWEMLHQSFIDSVREKGSEFGQLRLDYPDLTRFVRPEHLLNYFADRRGDLDEKDRLYATLVRAVQRNQSRTLAASLVWLGLWPALSAIYWRLYRIAPAEPDAAVSDIAVVLTSQMARLDFMRVRRIAATLVWNTERDVRGARMRAIRESQLVVPLSDDVEPRVEEPARQLPQLTRETLRALPQQDRDLLFRVALRGDTQLEAARVLGISHDAARKRYQRAVARIRHLVT
jgi:RNA polymerase sigma-70 factor (ECF subfamily)